MIPTKRIHVDSYPSGLPRRFVFATIFGFLILSALLYGCAVNPVTGGRQLVLMSENQEIALGREYNAEVLKRYKVYEDPKLQNYVEGIVEQLAAQSHRTDLVFHVTVLDSPEVNAFALPGGYIYITRGIMAYLNSEAQLAGVLGHEIGHVTARHAVRQHTTATLTQALGVAVAVGTGSRAASDLSGVLGTAVVRGYGRGHELEADRLGAEYLARTGYDPEQMIEVVSLLKNQEELETKLAKEEGREPRVYHGLFATHPKNDDRLKEVVAAAQVHAGAGKKPANEDTYLSHIEGLVFGPGETEGVVRDNRFFHKSLDFTIEFPQGWTIDNRPDKLIARAPGDKGLMQLTLTDLNKRQNAEQFLREHAGKRLSQGMPVANGFEAYTGLAEVDTPYGERHGRVAAVLAGKRVFMFTAAARESGTYDAEALAALKSLRPLKSEESDLAEPKRITLYTAKAGDTFAKLAQRSSLASHGEDRLRLINAVYPEGEPRAGQVIKLLQ